MFRNPADCLIRPPWWYSCECYFQPRLAPTVLCSLQLLTVVEIRATDTADEQIHEELVSTLELSTTPALAVGELIRRNSTSSNTQSIFALGRLYALEQNSRPAEDLATCGGSCEWHTYSSWTNVAYTYACTHCYAAYGTKCVMLVSSNF